MERRIDAWGVTWVRPVGEHNHGEKWGLPITNITHQADYVPPDENNPEFFKPHYEANWKLAHELGMDVWMHSCGYIVPLLPKLHAWGLNVIQQDQQENQGLEALDAAAGGKLAFWCPVDVQKTMVDGSVDDIRAYVKRMMAMIGSHNGGLFANDLPAKRTYLVIYAVRLPVGF